MMLQHFQISPTDGALFQLKDLLAMQLKGESLSGFILDWDRTLLYMDERPSDTILETLFWEQIQKSKQLEKSIALFKHNIAFAVSGWSKTYESEYRMVKIHLEERRKQRIREGYANQHQGQGQGLPGAQQTYHSRLQESKNPEGESEGE